MVLYSLFGGKKLKRDKYFHSVDDTKQYGNRLVLFESVKDNFSLKEKKNNT